MIRRNSGSGTGGGIVDSVGGVVKTIFGDKTKREQYSNMEQMAVLGQFAAEFQPRQNRTKWDSFVDGLNRLPRPFMTFGTIGLFIWAIVDPTQFAISMKALNQVPELMWYILLTIVAFWFGGKIIEKAPRKFTMPDAKEIREIKHLHDEIRSDQRFEEDMADEAAPMSNASILEWNKRREARREEQGDD
jgi:hypothetical protein